MMLYFFFSRFQVVLSLCANFGSVILENWGTSRDLPRRVGFAGGMAGLTLRMTGRMMAVEAAVWLWSSGPIGLILPALGGRLSPFGQVAFSVWHGLGSQSTE